MNRKKYLLHLFLLVFCFHSAHAQKDFTQYVNPFIGTGGHGHTFPGAVMPFGMVQLSPDTRVDGSWDGCSGYHYSDSVIYGFSHTHLSGTGCSDYGDILLMPTVGEPQLKSFVNGSYKKGYASHFSHKNESASVGYYSVHLDDDNIDAEFTVTPRVGFHKYTYPATEQANIILDLTHRDETLDAYVHVIDSRHIEGYRRSKAWAQNQVVYFYAEFSKQMEKFGIAKNDSLEQNVNEAQGKNVKAYFQFHTSKGEPVYVKVAISQTSLEGAQNNLRECLTWDFESVKRDATAAWNNELGKIEANGKDENQKKIFYTALYHCMIHPSIANDVDGKYLGRDFKVHQLEAGHNYYTVFSLWDTYRALHPLLSIIDEKRTTDFINTFLLEYDQCGRLPVWELSSNETDCMIGYHSIPVITDAALKGIKFDYNKALTAMMHGAELDDRGLKSYRERGYISMEDEGESVSKTLEYSYDDWCIAQMAKIVGDTAAYSEFISRGQYWKNVFDWKTDFMRPRKNGGWYSPFDPFQISSNYTEANAWQYLFAVPQDIDGLIMMMGGKQKFESKLDSLFTASSITSGMNLPDVAGLIGQYAQGNEPSHHMAYLYDYCGAPWKTEQRVRQIMDMYTNATDGLVGNEDCGQMSAWYLMSAIGIYEVTPGYPYYAIGSPLFDQVDIHLENQKTFSIQADKNSPRNYIITSLSLNGTAYDSILLSHQKIMSGGMMGMKMSGTASSLFHPKVFFQPSVEISNRAIVVNPVIQAQATSFNESLQVRMSTFSSSARVIYTDTIGTPLTEYDKPITITDRKSMIAMSQEADGHLSKITRAYFTKTSKNWKVNYLTKYDPQYTGGGDQCLIDEESGGTNFRNGKWQGWEGSDMEVVVDLGTEKTISKVGAGFLQDMPSWIMMPTKVDFEGSLDGKTFSPLASSVPSISDTSKAINTLSITHMISDTRVRFVKITAHNYGTLPPWHPGAGGKAWIFCDEIIIE